MRPEGLITALGLIIMAHTSYGVIGHRKLMKLVGEEAQIPSLLQIQLLFGVILAVVGAFMLSGSLKVAIVSRQGRSLDAGSQRTDFISFGLRSKAIPMDVSSL